jgi:hypothetical protein
MTAKIKFFLKFIVDKFLFFKTYEFIMNQENKYLSLISNLLIFSKISFNAVFEWVSTKVRWVGKL